MAMLLPRQMASDASAVDASQDQTKNLGAFDIVLVVITATCAVLRITSRKLTLVGFEADDWTFLAGAFIAEGLLVVSLIYSFDAGLGAHWTTLSPSKQALFPKLNYAYNILNLACYPLIKLSILFLYLRIFVSRRFRLFVWGGIVFVASMLVSNVLVATFACRPVRAFYTPSVPGTCIDSVKFYWATAVLNVATDLYILILPMPIVWGIQTSLRRKVAITIIFMLGGLTFIVSIVRIVYYLDYTATDPSWSFTGTAYATPAEVCLAVIVASAPTWRPVWARFADYASQVFSSFRSMTGRQEVRGSSDSDTEQTWRGESSVSYSEKRDSLRELSRVTPTVSSKTEESDDARSESMMVGAVV